MQQHSFGRPRLILAAVVFGAAAFLGARDGWTLPVKAGYPNPAWNLFGDGNGNLIGNVKRTEAVPGNPLNVTGTRIMSFDDLINGDGTTYAVYLWLDGTPTPPPGTNAAGATWQYWTFTKGFPQPEPFSFTATLTVNDNPNIAGFTTNRFWNWRVDVTSGGTTTGDVWQFRVPLEAPTNNSTDVSVYCKFEWEASSDYTTGVKTESIYVIDPNVVPSQVGKWYAGTGTTAPNGALTHKTINLFPAAPAFYGSAYPDYRQFWIHDTDYLFQGYPRLQPSTTYQWRIWYTFNPPLGTVNATANLQMLVDIPPTGAVFTLYDPTGNAGKGLTVPVTLTNVGDGQGVFAAAVQAAIQAAAPANSTIYNIVVTDDTNAAGLSQSVTLTWPVAGTPGNNVTITIPTTPAGNGTYLETYSNATPPVATAAGAALAFSGGVDSAGLYGPVYSFTTVSEAYVSNVDPFATQNYDQSVESLIVYWQHPQGTLARDPEENVTTFLPMATQLANIHEIDLQPTVQTVYFGTEQLAASYGGLDEVVLNNPQQVYVPDITAFDGWYTIGGATAVKGAYDTGQYTKRVGPGYPQTLPANPLFYSTADAQPLLYATQDRYSEWVAKGIRTWLQDAANGGSNNDGGWLPNNDHASLPNLKHVTLLGDAQRVAPSFYYYYSPWQVVPAQNRWSPTDFFYSTQTLNAQPGASAAWVTGQPITYIPSYQVSRIPIRSAPLITIDQGGNTFPPTPTPFGPPYNDPLPFLSKIRDYCDILNSSPSDAAKTTAFANWFHQVVMIDGATEYYKWFQFFPAFAQYLLGMQVQDNSLSPLRDAFSGMVVRKYDLNGLDGDIASYTTTGGEALTLDDILGRMSIDNGYGSNSWNTATADSDVPGFVYLNARGATNYGGADADSVNGILGQTFAGGVVDLTPADQTTALNTGSSLTAYTVTSTFDFTQAGPYFNELTLTTDRFPTYIPWLYSTTPSNPAIPSPSPSNAPTTTTKARPIMVSPVNVMNRYDNSIWGSNPYTSLGESAILAQGGPIAIAGFSSGRYEPSVQYTRTYGNAVPPASQTTLYNGPTDENEGYEFPTIGPAASNPNNTYGTADLTPFSADTDAVIGKLELCSYIAQQYGLVTSPVVGDLFNNALAQYVNVHLADLTAQHQREFTTIFGATLLGDCAVSMPGREPVETGDYSRPHVTAAGTGLRPASPVTGYSPASQYNSQNMPVYVIAHTTPYDPTVGAGVALNIQTSAPYVRVRVFTPFEQNTGYAPGEWVGGLGDMTAIAASPASAGTSIATNELICQTAAGADTVTFNALTPSVYFVVVQAQSPAWTGVTPTDPYRWLQERWFYIQVVNQFVRQTLDSTTGKKINVLVVDMDQHDRYYLNGALYTQHLLTSGQHIFPPVPGNILGYYFDTMADTFYVDPTQPDGTGINPLVLPENVSDSPALPYLNNQTNILNQYEYQFWCGNVYHSLATNGPSIVSSQRYYGEITPEALQSFQLSGGVVLWYTGDWNMDFPQGYLFQFDAVEPTEAGYLSSYLSNGGRLWLDSEDLTSQSAGFTTTYAGPLTSSAGSRLTEPWSMRTATGSPFALTLLSTYLGATPETLSTQYTNVNGGQPDTMSGGMSKGFTKDPQPISDVSDIGGDGRNSLQQASEVNPLNTTELAATVFTWNTSSGAGVTTGSKSSATQNILFTGDVPPLVLGGETIFFTWPLESVDHLGNIADDTTGRAYIVKAAIDWLMSTPAPLPGPVSNMLPANGATTTTLLPVLSWNAGVDATSYILEYGAGATLPVSPTTVPLAATSYTIPANLALVAGTTYTWTVISVNANGETPGPVQTFIAKAAGGGGGSTGTGSRGGGGTTGRGTTGTGTTGTGTTGTGTVTTATGGGGGGGGGGSSCFSMTAYERSRHLAGIFGASRTGSYAIAPEHLRRLNQIRALRDDLLMPFSSGRAFSAWYYAISPYGAAAIRDNESAKAAVRVMLLDPVAALSRECEQRVVVLSGRPTVR